MNAAMLNLSLAFFWLLVGATLLVLDWTGGARVRMPVGGQGFSMGWAALVLAGYNLIRWYLIRSYVARRRLSDERRRSPRRSAESPVERDPNFVFDDPPADGEAPRPPATREQG